MNCIHCHERMTHSTAPLHIKRSGYRLSFDTVPVWICKQCGQAYFEEREVNAIQGADGSLNIQIRQCCRAPD